jgi:N-acetylmuramoyl-L-alanine amidase
VELRNILVNSGRYRVLLVRDRDVDIPTEERRKRILALKGDFLISMHTNSNKDKNVRGISIYTLPSLDFLPKEVQDPHLNVDLYRNNLAASRNFANILIGYIPNACKIKNRVCRDGVLRILRVDKPAVLVECGHISNKIDDELLHCRYFREKANYAILYALDTIFRDEK